MKILLDMINIRALHNFEGTIDKDTYDEYRKLWIKTAEELKNEFVEQGLEKTANEVTKIIDYYRAIP